MPNHITSIPRPMYAYVKNEFLYDMQEGHGEVTSALLFGLSALPNRAWGISALLSNGALVQHLPVHAFTKDGESNHDHKLGELQVWSCYGQDFGVEEYSALSEISVRAYLKGSWEKGHYWFTAAPYNDVYSRTPDQHKHFNFVWLECGHLAALPGNRLLVHDPSFTVDMPEWGNRPKYKVNTQYWYPEDFDQQPQFDETVNDTTA